MLRAWPSLDLTPGFPCFPALNRSPRVLVICRASCGFKVWGASSRAPVNEVQPSPLPTEREQQEPWFNMGYTGTRKNKELRAC